MAVGVNRHDLVRLRALGELLPVIGAQSNATAARERLGPTIAQPYRPLAEAAVTGGAAHASHSAQQLSEDHRARLGAPTAHVIARRGQAGVAPKTPEDVVVGD